MEKNLLDTYLDYHNLTLRSTASQEPKRDGMPFMPMLLMDAMNLLYEEYIAPLPLKHREKQLRTRWHESYKHYINQEFLPFSDEQKCDICDLMDAFEKHIHNEIEMFRVATMSKFMQYDTDIRITSSAILACNALAQSAHIVWKATRCKDNPHLSSVEMWSYKLLCQYGDHRMNSERKTINLNDYTPLKLASKNICSKIIEFAEELKF